MRRVSWRVAVTLAAATVVAAVAAGTAAAATAPPLPSHDPFYSHPGSLAKLAPGTVLRTRPVSIAESGNATPVTATQVLYRTTGQLGQPTATVATVIRPAFRAALRAAAPRLVAYQTAYDALGSQCDPSYTLRGGNPGYRTAQAEEQLILAYAAAGDVVVVPDYEGERLDWGAGQESGYGTLDAVRAAEHLLRLAASRTPVGMVGYSGGSIATDFAAELAPRYAPQLDIVGTAEGGVPAHYFHNMSYVNGSSDWSGVIPAVLVSLARAYRVSFRPYLSRYGIKVAHQVSRECINSFAAGYPGLTIQRLLRPRYRNYRRIHDLVAIGDHMIMGRTGTPREPMYIGVGDSDGTGDGIMVTADVRALAHAYCARGTSVQLSVFSGQPHTAAAVPFEVGAMRFLTRRLAGLPVADGCASIGAGDSLAPLPVPPALKLAVHRAPGCRRGVVVRLASAYGPLTHVVVTLAHGRRRIAHRRLARLTMVRRRLILAAGRRAPRGRARLTVTQGGLTLAHRRVRIGRPARCLRRA